MTIYVQDNFDDTNNTELSNHNADPLGGAWALQQFTITPTSPIFRIKTNDTIRAEQVLAALHFVAVEGGGDVPVADYMVDCPLKIQTDSSQGTESMIVVARASNGSSGDKINGYGAALFTTPTTFKRGIVKWDDVDPGSPTILASENITHTIDGVFITARIMVVGDQITAFFGETTSGPFLHTLKVTDSSITAAGRPGFFFELDDTGNINRAAKVFTCQDLPVQHVLRARHRNQFMIAGAHKRTRGRYKQLANAWR